MPDRDSFVVWCFVCFLRDFLFLLGLFFFDIPDSWFIAFLDICSFVETGAGLGCSAPISSGAGVDFV